MQNAFALLQKEKLGFAEMNNEHVRKLTNYVIVLHSCLTSWKGISISEG